MIVRGVVSCNYSLVRYSPFEVISYFIADTYFLLEYAFDL